MRTEDLRPGLGADLDHFARLQRSPRKELRLGEFENVNRVFSGHAREVLEEGLQRIALRPKLLVAQLTDADVIDRLLAQAPGP